MPTAPPLRIRGVAALTFVGAVAGATISAWLTYVKFRRDFLCDGGGCLGGDAPSPLTCDQALDSPWSTFLELPWSLWSAAHAVAVAVLAVAMLRSRTALARSAPDILLALGGAAVAVSAVLFLYAWMNFDHLCPLCMCLYAYSLWTLGLALCVRGEPRASRVAVDALPIAALLLVLMGLQTLVYRIAARHAECPGLAPELPPVALVAPVDAPRTALLIFLDPSCERCRELHHRLQQPRMRRLLTAVEQRVYLAPRAVCDERFLPAHEFVDAAGNELSNDFARNHDACLAARVLYCLEASTPGVGERALTAVFQLQASQAEGPFFTFDSLVVALRGAGHLTDDVEPLRACVDGDVPAQAIAAAQVYLRDWVQAHGGKLGLPQIFVVPIVGGRLDLRAVQQAHDAEKLFRLLQHAVPEPSP
jgi:uncharacterized membrane protein